MNGVKRPVWPIFGRSATVMCVVSMVLFIAGIWGDSRFILTGLITLTAAAFLGIAAGLTSADGDTYTKRPRGWRKLRREAERRARIEQLERELGLNQ